jgi:integrase
MKKLRRLNQQFRMYRRGRVFYAQCNETGKQTSLRTKDEETASEILGGMNRGAKDPQIQREVALATLAVCDPDSRHRAWSDVFEAYASSGKQQTRERKRREFRSQHYATICDKPLVDTMAEDFYGILSSCGSGTSHYLKRAHNYAVEIGWLPKPVIPSKLWPKTNRRPIRAISAAEHERILESEKNAERKLYYQLLWEIGASQKDAAELDASNIDWKTRVLTYKRKKTDVAARLKIGAQLEALLEQLPKKGPLFPSIGKRTSNQRAAEFCRRRGMVGVKGVSLHSYRYAWAERAYEAGYPERMAQASLGQHSAAVHRHYAKGAEVVCPPLDEFENERKLT